MSYHAVWKYPLSIVDRQSVPLPSDAKILTVAMQRGNLELWALVQVRKQPDIRPRLILIAGTGHEREDLADAAHISTFQLGDGGLVFHVFDGGAA